MRLPRFRKIVLVLLLFLPLLTVNLSVVENCSARAVVRGHHVTSVVRTGPAASGSVHKHHHRHKRRYEERKDFRDDVRRDRRRWRVGTSLTAAAFRNLSCRSEVIVIGHVTYYRCGGSWYRRVYTAGTVTYIVVEVPAGY